MITITPSTKDPNAGLVSYGEINDDDSLTINFSIPQWTNDIQDFIQYLDKFGIEYVISEEDE